MKKYKTRNLISQYSRRVAFVERIFSFASTVFIVLSFEGRFVNAQSEKQLYEYWYNVPSTPVRIVVQKGVRPDRLDEFFENVSYGSVTALKLGCITIEHSGYEIGIEEKDIEINLSPLPSQKGKVLLPKGSHGSDISICRGAARVAIVAVRFVDGGKWTIR